MEPTDVVTTPDKLQKPPFSTIPGGSEKKKVVSLVSAHLGKTVTQTNTRVNSTVITDYSLRVPHRCLDSEVRIRIDLPVRDPGFGYHYGCRIHVYGG